MLNKYWYMFPKEKCELAIRRWEYIKSLYESPKNVASHEGLYKNHGQEIDYLYNTFYETKEGSNPNPNRNIAQKMQILLKDKTIEQLKDNIKFWHKNSSILLSNRDKQIS